jgi:hypothetical protein
MPGFWLSCSRGVGGDWALYALFENYQDILNILVDDRYWMLNTMFNILSGHSGYIYD